MRATDLRTSSGTSTIRARSRCPHDDARGPARAPRPGPDAGGARRGARPRARPPRRGRRCRASAARPGAGTGTELAQIRPYQVGDDVRRIDAAASARTGVPHVRDHVPERTLTTWMLVDVSASMAFGTAERLKSDVAEGVALVIGRLAVRRAGRDRAADLRRARTRSSSRRAAGRRALVALRRALGAGVAPDGARRPQDVARRTACAGSAGSPAATRLVVVVSRLPRGSSDWPAARCARWRCATTCSRSRSSTRARASCPTSGHLALVDPETGQRVEVDSSSAELRRRFAAAELERRDDAEVAPAPRPRAPRRGRDRRRLAARARKEPAMSFQAPLFLLGLAVDPARAGWRCASRAAGPRST